MAYFDLRTFINENKLGAYALLKENKYFTTDEDGDEILNLDLASEYLSQTHNEEDVEAFFSDDEVFEDLPYGSEDFPTEEAVEGALDNAFEFYSGGGDVFEKLDPVGKEDSDINNDGKVDKTDKYLANRRKAVSNSTKNEAVGGEMAEMLGAFLALVGAGKTALEAVKILGDEHGDISISSIKDAIKQYKASKDMKEDFDIGHEDDEPSMLKNKMYRASKLASMLFDKLDKYDDMSTEVDFPDWWQTKLSKAKDMLQSAYDYLDGEEGVAQIGEKYDREEEDGHIGTNTDDDFEREMLQQLAQNEDVNEEASGLEFKVGDKVTYLGNPGVITNAGTDIMDRPQYSVSYNKGTGDTKVTNVYNKGGEIKKAMSEKKVEENLLKQDALSPAEYQKAKKLKGFDSKNYKWDPKQALHLIRKMYEKKIEVDDDKEFTIKLSHLLDKHAE